MGALKVPITFLGGGAMGCALMRGVLAAQVYQPYQITLFDASKERMAELATELKISTCENAVEAARGAKVLLVAVKPHIVAKALAPLRDVLDTSTTVISIAAGVTLYQLESCFSNPVPVVRVMPNTPCLVGESAAAICLGTNADAMHLQQAHQIFDAVGLAVDVEERLMDAVTGLSGSGPAYVYLFIEALSDGGVKMGLPRDVATRLAAQTVLGAAKMVLQTGDHPGQLKDQVTSPGGTTIAGIHALEDKAFRSAVMDAVQVSARRSKELSPQ
jgi:pyrroline-5-carboxylate reductase